MFVTMKFEFQGLPVEVTWCVFDEEAPEKRQVGKAQPGDSVIQVTVPSSYGEPFVSVRCADGYTIRPDQRRALSDVTETVEVDGSIFYLDVDRTKHPYELNHEATKKLVTGAAGLTGRGRFFTALVALETHLEYLTFAMLVLSGHRSNSQFKGLNKQQNRAIEAFDSSNSAFFGDPVLMPGDRELTIGEIPGDSLRRMQVIFDEVRKLRNKVVHEWTYKHPDRSDLARRFLDLSLIHI